ncbi:alpha/beta fold hydrolase [Myxosarcina sp. GI1]|uniref:alpha/beta fold hydrolase n=1 Tax=Myxosarcina sp. GI1 TaxID=1541065 RepID=UPI0005650F99|nr:alpha/beta fold hydrolase [Myxosarcina sp. GI1]
MSITIQTVQTVWIDANPSFKRFHQRLLRCLTRLEAIACWEYQQELDEPCSLDIALSLLHDYLKNLSRPVNLIGHGTGGLLGLLYARKYPHRVKSLTLLGVGYHPAVDWQAHYYASRKLLPCSQNLVLAQMVQKLFGYQNRYNTKGLIKILQQDLKTSPSPHSLYQQVSLPTGGVIAPMMVCGGEHDSIIDFNSLSGWLSYFREYDVIWECPQGCHFFHFFFPDKTSRQIIKFWDSLAKLNVSSQTKVRKETCEQLS